VSVRRRIACLGALLATALAAVPAAEAARKSKQPGTLADLAGRSVPVQRGEAIVSDSGQAARSYEEFLRIEGADPALRAQALRRLGDLRLGEAEALAAGGDAQAAAAVEAARQAVAAYRQLLDEQPDYSGADAVLYQLARALDHGGEPDAALATLERLVREYPRSDHYAEAEFRRGESFFSAARYADAERAYAAVLSAGPQSGFGQQAQYKYAWALFKQGRDEEGNSAFLVLLDGLLAGPEGARPDAELSRAERELADDALRALAITFAAGDGPASLLAALDAHGPVPYAARLYSALGDLYVEKERYQDGAEAYRAFARREPMNPQAPLLLVRATEAYAKGGFASLVLDGKRQLALEYGPSSAFWAAQAGAVDPAVSAAVQSSLLELAQHHHALAQKDGAPAERDEAVRWYREYLAGFDDTPQAPGTRLLLADLLFEGKSFAAAAVEYERAAYGYAAHPEAGRAGYAALVAWADAEAQAAPESRAEISHRAIESSLRFADTFPTHPETAGVLTRTAKALFDADDRERAESVAQRVLDPATRADAAQQLVAWTVLAHTYFDSGRYAEAERAYGELSRRLPAGDPLQAEATERLAASVYRQAEAKQAAGDLMGAVQEFRRVAVVAPSSPTRAAAEFDAATILIGAGEWTEAASVLEGFRRDHPGHVLQAEVTRKLAVAYLEGGRSASAAVEFERVAATAGEPEDVRRAARWQAAELYVEAGDVAAARRAYAAYVQEFPTPFAPALEARHELAELAKTAGDARERERWLGELVAADAAAGTERSDRSRFLAAEASLELARPLDAEARAVRLVAPLDRSLLKRKKALEAALAAYGRAAEYAVAGVTTASSFAMADLYRDFGRALLESERPGNLSADELEQYDLLLEEQAFPFEEKAIDLHERNARRAAGGVYDEWVQKSYAALAGLKPGRWARTEREAGAEMPALEVEPLEAALAAVPAVVAAATNAGETAVAADPAKAVVLNRLGVAYRRLGRFDDARAAYERAIAADPASADAECNLAILLDLYLDEPATALPHYERYQALTGEADTRVSAWVVELRQRLDLVQRTAEVQP
jgi:tetratricopeptide (TPR) repeat protein